MYHHFDRKNQLFIMRYIPSLIHEILFSKLPSGGGICSKPLSHLQQPSTASGEIPSCLSMILHMVSWLPSIVASSWPEVSRGMMCETHGSAMCFSHSFWNLLNSSL